MAATAPTGSASQSPAGDLWTRVAVLDDATLERQAQRLEVRAADDAQRAMRQEYLAHMAFPRDARVLEVGSGTGAVCRELALWPGVGEVLGIDPSPFLIERARTLASRFPNVSFELGDARMLPLEDHSFDVVIFHTTLCHVPDPQRALAEARRVLRPAGWLAVFDGDYATTTVARAANDPLQVCVDGALTALVHDPWLVRKLRALVARAGFIDIQMRSHGYLAAADPRYFLGVLRVGAEALAEDGSITPGMVDALLAEAEQRVEEGTFFGHIAYASVIARAPSE